MSEWRKFHLQMTKWELKKLYEIIHTHQFNYTDYSHSRLQQRDICELSVEKTIKYGKIIEFHYKDGDVRILIRGIANIDGNAVCVVLSLGKRQIITVYQNEYDDKHYTLHKEIYNNKVDLMRYMNVG